MAETAAGPRPGGLGIVRLTSDVSRAMPKGTSTSFDMPVMPLGRDDVSHEWGHVIWLGTTVKWVPIATTMRGHPGRRACCPTAGAAPVTQHAMLYGGDVAEGVDMPFGVSSASYGRGDMSH